jgi:hypothetical protein
MDEKGRYLGKTLPISPLILVTCRIEYSRGTSPMEKGFGMWVSQKSKSAVPEP